MDGFVLISLLLATIGSAVATDWNAIGHEMKELGYRVKIVIGDIRSAIINANAAIGDKVDPTLQDHEQQAVSIIEGGKREVESETLTVDYLDDMRMKIAQVEDSLKIAIEDDVKQLPDRTKLKIRRIFENRSVFYNKFLQIKKLLARG